MAHSGYQSAECPGPAERVGKTMDKGVAKVGEGLEKAGEAIQGTAQGN